MPSRFFDGLLTKRGLACLRVLFRDGNEGSSSLLRLSSCNLNQDDAEVCYTLFHFFFFFKRLYRDFFLEDE